MAKGDVKQYRGRGGGGWGSSYSDEGRGESKRHWEEFLRRYEESDFDCAWLFTLSDEWILEYMKNTTERYGIGDSPRVWREADAYGDRGPEWLEERHREDDSRMARIIKKHCGEDVWCRFSKHFSEAYVREKARVDEAERVRQRQYEATYRERRAARDAEELKVRQEETAAIREEVDLTVGMLRSDFAEALRWKEVYGLRNGDWLDDPVSGYITGHGFGEEVKERSGIKLQVTVSLDMSNSMAYNGIDQFALDAFRTIFMSLEALQREHSGDLFTAAFSFSGGDTGKHTQRITNQRWDGGEREPNDEYDLGTMESWRVSGGKYGSYQTNADFTGEDTWFYPLFEEVEEWEKEHSDPGAVRLDIVVTDAVLEHKTDIRRSSEIQERRDGALQSVFLNLMHEDDWADSTLPLRCVQYPADRDNLGGLLRNVLAEFVAVYL